MMKEAFSEYDTMVQPGMIKFAVVVSQKDIAGMSIKDDLIKKSIARTEAQFENSYIYKKGNASLYTIQDDTIHSESLDKRIDADVFIFATRHSSASKKPSLSCHVPGNWSNAEHGGSSSQLCIAPALMLKKAFLTLKKLSKGLQHEVTLEATHHGPLLGKPCMFIEIGSDEAEWAKPALASIIADTILEITSSPLLEQQNEEQKQKIAVAIGGPHYCAGFNKVLESTNIAIGHICPKHSLEHLDESLLMQAVERTSEKVDFVLLDWKGLGTQKQRIIEMIKKAGISFVRSDKVGDF